MTLRTFSIVPVISTSIYAAGDQIGAPVELTNVFKHETDTVEIKTMTVVDKDKQDAEIDFLFFNQSPTMVSTDNVPADITDANLVAQCVGTTTIVAANYADLTNNSIGSLSIEPIQVKGADINSRGTSLWVVGVVRTTPTYTSTSGMTWVFGVETGARG